MADGWQAYIKNLFDSAPTVIKKAAIIGVSDGGIWAKSTPPLGENFNVSFVKFSYFSLILLFQASSDELQKISSIFQNVFGTVGSGKSGFRQEGQRRRFRGKNKYG
jgi:hypothetical protein